MTVTWRNPIPLAPLKRGDKREERSEKREVRSETTIFSKSPFPRGI
jgi:hypothetical protein